MRRHRARAAAFTAAALAFVAMLAFALSRGSAGAAGAGGSAPKEAVEGSGERDAPRGASLAEQFFVSYQIDPNSDDKRIEIIGSMMIWLLLLLSAVSIGLIGHLALTNQRKSIIPEGVVERARLHVGRGEYRDVLALAEREASFFSRVLVAALQEASHGYSAMIRRLEQVSDEMTTERLRRIEYLNVLGQVSPMIGLFGTVYGMILAFQAIVVAGGNADPVLLAGGIGTALVTTFWGLIIAIPALSGYAIIRNKIDSLTAEATATAEELVNQFRPKAAARPAASPAAASSSSGSSRARAGEPAAGESEGMIA